MRFPLFFFFDRVFPRGFFSFGSGAPAGSAFPIEKSLMKQRMLKKTAAGNTIFLRSGEGFEALPAEAGGVNASWAWSPMLCDFDLDGRTDIFVTNGFVTGDLAHDT